MKPTKCQLLNFINNLDVATGLDFFLEKPREITGKKCFSAKNGLSVHENWTAENFHRVTLSLTFTATVAILKKNHMKFRNDVKKTLSANQAAAKLRLDNLHPVAT